MNLIFGSLAFLIFAPLVCGLLAGFDRIITARMQGRFGPPLLQPFYDVFKLFEKENLGIDKFFHSFYLICYLIFMLASGILFFTGQDILLVIFAFTLADIFLVLAAYSTNSPYSFIGAERELLLMMSAEPMILISAVGLFMATKSFKVTDILIAPSNLIIYLPGVFLGLLFILTIKLRKSPFDLSTSHHAHQEIVKGITTEFAGPSLAIVEIVHWYETAIMLGIVFLFFAASPVLGIGVVLAAYFIEILIDNTFARFKWELTLKSSWLVTILFGGINLVVLFIIDKVK
ncbi:MAG: NADH-quinone oxidoreductase subunit H [Lentisphaerae bacterium]|nr:NADH-quinone oxidoreductase subunit H [Lentisphaerota bacterium]